MRVAGIPLGVGQLDAPALELYLDVNFANAPIIDNTARHTLSYPSGVTVSGGVGVFDGNINSYITVEDNQSDWIWLDDFLVTCTVTPDTLTSFRTIWDSHDSTGFASTQRFGIYTEPSGALAIYSDGQTLAATSAGAIQVGVSSDIIVRRINDVISFIVDGVLISSFSNNNQFSSTNRKVYIGTSAYSTDAFSGTISNFKIHTT